MVKKPKQGRFIIYHPWYTRQTVAAIDDGYVVFGDNVAGTGTGPKSGQAVIRGLPNALGIKVKWKPTNEPDAFFTDDNPECAEHVRKGFSNVIRTLKAGSNVYYPVDGIGTGRADLKLNAPALYAEIEMYAKKLIETYG